MMGRELLLAHAALTYAWVGIIWFVQLAHYPLLAYVKPDALAAYAREHIRHVLRPAVVMMSLELLTGLPLLFFHPVPAAIGLALLAVIWGLTWRKCLPLHRNMACGQGEQALADLLRVNWIRTVCWTLRGVLVTWMLKS